MRSSVLPSVGIFLAAALALAGALDYYQYLSAYSSSPDSLQVAAQHERLRDALSSLPDAGPIGYLSDQPFAAGQGQVMFGIAQHALAPRVLVPLKTDSKTDWVLGNFANPPDTARLAARHSLRLISDYGNGVVLFRKETGR